MAEYGDWPAMVYYVVGNMTNLYEGLPYIFAPKGVNCISFNRSLYKQSLYPHIYLVFEFRQSLHNSIR